MAGAIARAFSTGASMNSFWRRHANLLTILANTCTFPAKMGARRVMPKSADVRERIPIFNLLLEPEFTLNALILASEALRIANQNSGRLLFRFHLVSETGGAVRASNGMWLDVDCALDTMPEASHYILFGGNLPTQHNSSKLLNHLRAAARFGALVGGVDTGAFALAKAGLIANDTAEVVLHWEATPTFRELFPDANVLDRIYHVSGNRALCAGGVSTLDMMLELIAGCSEEALADEVSNALIHTRRPGDQPQRGDASARPEADTLAVRLVQKMEQNLDFPLTLEDLARELAVSPRSLSRLCQRSFDESPMRLYLRVRLQAARNFLFYEEFSIGDVANACGFSYPAVFSRVFKKQYDQTPREFREELRHNQHTSLRPEIRRLSRQGQEPPRP